MKKKTKRYDNGGRTFSAEQEAWLGGADRTDPYILARMERAVPSKKAPVVDSVKPKTRAEVEAENAVSEAPKKDLSEIRSEDGSLSKLRRNTETGELYSRDEPITRSFAKSSSSKPKAPANPATKSAKSEISSALSSGSWLMAFRVRSIIICLVILLKVIIKFSDYCRI